MTVFVDSLWNNDQPNFPFKIPKIPFPNSLSSLGKPSKQDLV